MNIRVSEYFRFEVSTGYGACMEVDRDEPGGELAQRFTAFYGRMYNPMLRMVARRAVGIDGEALLHDAFVVAWQHLQATGQISRSWFVRVVRNKLGDHYRAASRRESATDVHVLQEIVPSCDPMMSVGERVDVWRAMQLLPVDKYEALVLALWCDMSNAEAAAALGISVTAFSTRLSRAKRAFVVEYAPHGEVEDHEEVVAWIAQNG